MAKVVKRAYKYRFYPSPEQAAELARTFGCIRKVWNLALDARTAAGLAVLACGGGVRPKPGNRGGQSPAKQEPLGASPGTPVLWGGEECQDRSLTMSTKSWWMRRSGVSSGWNAVASAGPWRTATILPVRASVPMTSTPSPACSTQGALMNTARKSGPG